VTIVPSSSAMGAPVYENTTIFAWMLDSPRAALSGKNVASFTHPAALWGKSRHG
jgi:hypothetical protein